MKYIVQDHDKQPDSAIIEALEADEWDYNRHDLTEKAVMYFLYHEQDMSNKEIETFLAERVDKPFTLNDVTMSLRWFGLIRSHGKPLQARASSIAELLSFGHELR